MVAHLFDAGLSTASKSIYKGNKFSWRSKPNFHLQDINFGRKGTLELRQQFCPKFTDATINLQVLDPACSLKIMQVSKMSAQSCPLAGCCFCWNLRVWYICGWHILLCCIHALPVHVLLFSCNSGVLY